MSDKTAADIVALGDSITYGCPYTPRESWVYITSVKLGIKIINKGINGDTTEGMLARFATDVLKYNPLRVIIMGGTNDAYLEIETAQLMENLASMVKIAQSNEIGVILGFPIPCHDAAVEALLQNYRAGMRQYASMHSLAVLDFGPALSDTTQVKRQLYSDSAHPNGAGYRVMADVAIRSL